MHQSKFALLIPKTINRCLLILPLIVIPSGWYIFSNKNILSRRDTKKYYKQALHKNNYGHLS